MKFRYITIEREYGSGARMIGNKLAERLGVPCYGTQILEMAAKKLDTTDAERSEYYYEHTGKAWGDVNNYHMILNTSDIGVDRCADALIRYFEQKEII